MEIKVFQDADMVERALHHRLRRRVPVLLKQMVLQRTSVDSDADRDAAFLACLDDGFHLLPLADVAGIDPDLVDAVLNRRERQADS